jgi:Domain of unknown function (DUF4397)
MPFLGLHLATRTRRLTALAALILALTGCQGIAGNEPYTQVRFINASPDAGGTAGLDVYQNSSGVLYNIPFGATSSYVPLSGGGSTFSVVPAGTQQQLAFLHSSVTPGAQFTVLTGDVAANLQMTVLKDQSTPAPAGEVALRFVDQATRIGPVDIYLLPSGGILAGLTPIVANLTFGNTPVYLGVPAGAYTLVVFPAGAAIPTAASAIYTGTQIAYPATAVRTILLIDQQPATKLGLQAKVLVDYDPAN